MNGAFFKKISFFSEPIPAEIDTERRGPPPGVVDFDAANADDHNQVSDYVMDVFQYYKNREVRRREQGQWIEWLRELLFKTFYFAYRFSSACPTTCAPGSNPT